ncbi:MAG TPA: spore germination protein GerW family protein [Candidatus Limnocylindrales bacterium]|nr:spore germination protein GerW family protein [Candidatus Limnocylindrales bacterium]
MTTDYTGTAFTSDAAAEAARAATGPQDAILEKLVEKVGGKASVKAVFGEPIERGGKTVVPVAKVRWGFGGGAGTGTSEADGAPQTGSGSGGGGGVTAEPIGYLEIGEEGAAFRSIAPPYPSPLFLLAAGITSALIVRAFARLIRG